MPRCPQWRWTIAMVLAAGSCAAAQPDNDSCSHAAPLFLFATVHYDNTGATLDGPSSNVCGDEVHDQIDADLWWLFVPPITGPVRLFTCNLTSSNTKVAVYQGGLCPVGSRIIACNDEFCPPQSYVSWFAQAGREYLIRIGNSPGSTPGPGMFQLDSAILNGPIINPANGHSYFLLSPRTATDAEAIAVAMGGHLATIRSAAENEFIRSQVLGFDGERHGWIGLREVGVGGTFVWSSGEPVSYTNWAPGEPDNPTAEPVVEMSSATGQWSTTRVDPPILEYPIVEVFDIGGGSTCYANCDRSYSIPFLNINDFICFQTRFAVGDPYANCDGSWQPPILSINDFICFMTVFAAGCSAP